MTIRAVRGAVRLTLSTGRPDQATTWSVATAQWSPRSDIAACTPPYTNTIWMAGGQVTTGTTVLNEVWYSTDGAGNQWTQGPNIPTLQFHAGTCAFYYDSAVANTSLTAANPTLFLTINNGTTASSISYFLLSYDGGNTWPAGLQRAPWSAWNFMNVLVDPSNNVYVLGGQNSYGSSVWWSNNYGSTWYVLAAANSLNLPDAATFYYATTSCAALTYWRNQTAGIWYRTIALYGGSVWLSDNNIDEAIHGITTSPVVFGGNVPSVQWTDCWCSHPATSYLSCLCLQCACQPNPATCNGTTRTHHKRKMLLSSTSIACVASDDSPPYPSALHH